MPSCDGFLGRFVVDGQVPGGFGQAFTWDGLRTLTLEDGVLGGKVVLAGSAPLRVEAAPLLTVSQSEDGFEKIMQALTLRLAWDAPIQALSLTITPDRAAA